MDARDDDQLKTEPPKPVAYDVDGNPLYAAPPSSNSQDDSYPRSHVTAAPESLEGHNFNPRMRVQYANEPRVVHSTRAYEPVVNDISEGLKDLHDRSCQRYPSLNLSAAEFVIISVKRHPIGLLVPLGVTIGTIILPVIGLIMLPAVASDPASTISSDQVGFLALILMCVIVIVGIGGYAAAWVYQRNTFYLTNESVVQEIQHSVFSKHEQTVSLGSIEDTSFRQSGILQSALNYGSIRLSTEGEETTYRFHYVSNPKKQLAILNNAIESFKNGRPVNPCEDDEINEVY